MNLDDVIKEMINSGLRETFGVMISSWRNNKYDVYIIDRDKGYIETSYNYKRIIAVGDDLTEEQLVYLKMQDLDSSFITYKELLQHIKDLADE
jgi:hypothetical protein